MKRITIAGGGIAGLALGIGLRNQEVPVELWEALEYPRHRVCGEFISGRGQAVLGRLRLAEHLERLGAIPAHSVSFFHRNRRVGVRRLPKPALSLSRYEMDALMAKVFGERGGELRLGRWVGEFGEGVVRATGRRIFSPAQGGNWFGLKVQVRGLELKADLEMHLAAHGYVGLSRLPGGKVNVCGLFRRAAETGQGGLSVFDRLCGPSGTELHRQLRAAEYEPETLCSVAGFSLAPERAMTRSECVIGDAMVLIPPITGNGMSMALEAAEIGVEPLVAFSRGELTWDEAQRAIARECDAAFGSRLAWARWLQQATLHPKLGRVLSQWLLSWEILWRQIFLRTR